MVEAARLIAHEFPPLQIVVPIAPGIPRHLVEAPFAGKALSTLFLHERVPEAVGASDVAIVASGTATLEAGLMHRPMVVIYRVSTPTWLVGRAMVKVPHIALVNLLSGRRVVPELLQREMTPERIAAEVRRMWSGPSREVVIRGLADLQRHLGERGASHRAAEAVLELLDQAHAGREGNARAPATDLVG
jgi:lipid-A-disaccharide synthase